MEQQEVVTDLVQAQVVVVEQILAAVAVAWPFQLILVVLVVVDLLL
jgi:hypothetical protein